MDDITRANLVRHIRFESKQARGRAPRPVLTPQEERDRETIRQSKQRLRSSRRTTAYGERERLRTIRESGADNSMGDAARDHVIRNSNVRFQSRTGFSSREGVEVTLTPAERVNRVGVASRRRGSSNGNAPPAPGEAGHAAYVARYRRGTRERALRRGDIVTAIRNR